MTKRLRWTRRKLMSGNWTLIIVSALRRVLPLFKRAYFLDFHFIKEVTETRLQYIQFSVVGQADSEKFVCRFFMPGTSMHAHACLLNSFIASSKHHFCSLSLFRKSTKRLLPRGVPPPPPHPPPSPNDFPLVNCFIVFKTEMIMCLKLKWLPLK